MDQATLQTFRLIGQILAHLSQVVELKVTEEGHSTRRMIEAIRLELRELDQHLNVEGGK